MDVVAAFIITFIFLIFSVYRGVFLAYPLMLSLILFFILAVKRGYSSKDVLIMALNGGKKSIIVIKVFILIGAIVAVWMASGTVPAIVYYGIKLIKPKLFILSAFLISSLVSFLIGTSVGTVGTVGIALMVVARGGNASIAATAGAIIAGAYFGDRCSPMSSSASLVAFLTETNIYDNIKNMFKTCIVPFGISVIFYTIISRIFPLHESANNISNEITKVFSINMFVMIPAVIIIIFSLLRINVKNSMLVSIIAAFVISIFVQHYSLYDCIKFIVMGYSMDKSNPLYLIIKGGGIVSMLKTSLIIAIASAFAGIIEETQMLIRAQNITSKARNRYEVFRNVAVTSILAGAVGCSQTFGVILTHMLNKKTYEKNRIDNSCLAADLENTAIMISALIPWNVALLLPITILGADFSCMPYLMYIYILPIINLVFLRFNMYKISSNISAEV